MGRILVEAYAMHTNSLDGLLRPPPKSSTLLFIMIQIAAQRDNSRIETEIDNPTLVKPVHKAYAYIVQFDRLLVFREPDFPEAGVQVPGGTVELGETYSQAALREAQEETGLSKLRLVRKLGLSQRDTEGTESNPIFDHFFHLTTNEILPESWQHVEERPSNGGDPILFEFYWIKLHAAQTELWPWQSRFLKEFD